MFAFWPTSLKTVRRAAIVPALAVSGILLVSACGSGTGPSAAAAHPAATPPGAAALPAAAAPITAPMAPVTVAVSSGSGNSIVVDGAGRTLYRYDKDTAGSGSSVCTGACAVAWPPALVTGPASAGSGVSGSLAVITRADGTHQVALDGHPLYRYSGDQNQGDTTGDGFGGIWHVVPATTAAMASSTGPSPTASGY